MNNDRPGYRNLRTGQVVGARQLGASVKGRQLRETLRPDVDDPVNLSEWVPGVIGSNGTFYPSDQSISFILRFPPDTTTELDHLIEEAGGDATEFFKRAIALYKLAKDATHEGKVVGIASSPDCLETQFIGI